MTRGRSRAFVLGLAVSALASGCGRPAAVTFGVIADCQFAAVPTEGSRFFSYSWLKLRNALDDFNARGVSFVVHLGDLVDRDSGSYDIILPGFEHSKAPVRFVLGNHDLDAAPEPQAGLLGRLGIGLGYYAFTSGAWRFIVLNGDELGFNFSKDASLESEAARLWEALVAAKKPNATKWNGGLGRKQLDFLEAELSAADRKGLGAIVFCHFPVLPPAGHNLWNDEVVVALLEKHPSVKAFFSGHNHAGGYAMRNGIAYLTFAGMVETRDTSAGAVVTITADGIVIDGFGREPDRTIALR
jgi:manganese-dependent ADP-ribose/CDP-alcohol diphosphatase